VLTGVDQEIGNVVSFGLALFQSPSNEAFEWIFKAFMEQCKFLNKQPSLIITELDKGQMKALKSVFPQGKRLVNHFSVAKRVQELLLKTQKGDPSRRQEAFKLFQRLLNVDTEEIAQCLVNKLNALLDAPTVKLFKKEVFKHSRKFFLSAFSDKFTGGLHSYDRGKLLENLQKEYNTRRTLP